MDGNANFLNLEERLKKAGSKQKMLLAYILSLKKVQKIHFGPVGDCEVLLLASKEIAKEQGYTSEDMTKRCFEMVDLCEANNLSPEATVVVFATLFKTAMQIAEQRFENIKKDVEAMEGGSNG